MKLLLLKKKTLLFCLNLFSIAALAQTNAFVTITTTGNNYTHQNQITEFLIQVGNVGDQAITDGILNITPAGDMTYMNASINCITAPGYNGESICPNLVGWDGLTPITDLIIPEGAVLQFNIQYYVSPTATLENNTSLTATYINNVIVDNDISNNSFTLSLTTKPQFTRKLEFKLTAIPTSLNATNTFDLLFVRTSPYKWRDDTLSVPITLSTIDSRLGTTRSWGEVTTNTAQDEVYISFDYTNPTAYWNLPTNQLLDPFHPRGTDHNISEMLRLGTIEHMGFFSLQLGAFPYQIYTNDSYLDLTYLLFDAKPYFQNDGNNFRAYDYLGVVNNYQRIGDLDMSLYPRNVEPDSFRCFFETPVYYKYTSVKSNNNPIVPLTEGTARVRIHGKIDLYISDLVLPVKLESFDLIQENNNLLIKWVTATEENNKGFYIQHSSNGKDWNDIHFVDTKSEGGYSYHLLEYKYLDLNAIRGINYYRLKQIDFDEKETYSNIKSIKLIENNHAIKVFPNPATDKIVIDHIQPGTTIQIINSSGKQMDQKIAISSTETILLNNYSKGIYFIKTTFENKTSTHRFIKQ